MKRDDFHPMRIMNRSPIRNALLGRLLSQERFDSEIYSSIMVAPIREMAEAAGEEPARTIMSQMMVDSYFSAYNGSGRIIITPDAEIEAMLMRTDLGDVEVGDLRLPFKTAYIGFSGKNEVGALGRAPIDGMYISVNDDCITGAVTSRWPSEERRPWPLDEETIARFVLETVPGKTIHDALEDWITKSKANLADKADTSMLKEFTRNAVLSTVELSAVVAQNQKAMHRAILLGLNVATYMAHAPDDAENRVQVDDAPTLLAEKARRPGRQGLKARQALIAEGYIAITVVGRRFERPASDSAACEDGGKARSAHWRRGHWRRQKHGPQRSMMKLKWIMPMKIGANDHDAPGRVYTVKS